MAKAAVTERCEAMIAAIVIVLHEIMILFSDTEFLPSE